MKIYLVGGAVRDQLLGYPTQERDWVVIGAKPEEMHALGYQQVGKDFPVFLHPQTKEEYALARKERKSGSGYYGFECDFGSDVSLEDDLIRRDLTINAIAMDEQGQLIDPYDGQGDLQKKLLRHVSSAFIEDPVRVLRIARFAARYYHLGFRIADDTRQLMYQMAQQGELNHLVPERVSQELLRSLSERNPEIFIQSLRDCGALQIVFPELHALFGVPNTQHYHHEIDSGVHTLMVLQAAVRESDSLVQRFGALVHDLGKAATPIKEWPKHHQHEERGVVVINNFCSRLRIPADYRNFAMLVSRVHLIIHRLFELRAVTIVKTLEQADAFRRPALFNDLLNVCLADARGCGREVDYKQASEWQNILQLCQTFNAKVWIAQGLQGEAIKKAIHEQRVNAVQQLISQWDKHEK